MGGREDTCCWHQAAGGCRSDGAFGKSGLRLHCVSQPLYPSHPVHLLTFIFFTYAECETCGKQDLLHLSCNKCASPVCGDCVSGKCGVCGADLQLAFRGAVGLAVGT